MCGDIEIDVLVKWTAGVIAFVLLLVCLCDGKYCGILRFLLDPELWIGCCRPICQNCHGDL